MFPKVLLTALAALALAAPAIAGDGSREARGAVSAVSAASITVTAGEKDPLTCAVSDHSPSVAGVKVGDLVEVSCKRIGSDLVLAGIKTSEGKDKGKSTKLKAKGAVAEASASVLSIKTGKGDLVSCLVPDRLADRVAKLALGDKVGISCKRGADGKPVLQALERAGKGDDHASSEAVDLGGAVSAVSADSLTVKDGEHSLTCSVPDAFAAKVSALTVGDRVKMVCKGGVLAGLARAETPKSDTPKPDVKQFGARGAISTLSASSITVSTDGAPLTCRVPVSWADRIAGFAVGDRVKLSCRGVEGNLEATGLEKVS